MTKVLLLQIAEKMLRAVHCISCATFLIYGVMTDCHCSFDQKGTWQGTVLTTLRLSFHEQPQHAQYLPVQVACLPHVILIYTDICTCRLIR